MKNVFYYQGLGFSCIQCSDCCRHDPGVVLLSKVDLKRLSLKLKLSPGDFIKKFCFSVPTAEGSFISLKEKKNNDCIFWDQRCCVYDARPIQCMSYPFWSKLVESRSSWESEARFCPGIGKGQIHPRKEIETWLESCLSNPPLTVDYNDSVDY